VGKQPARSSLDWEASDWTAPACGIGGAADLLNVRIPVAHLRCQSPDHDQAPAARVFDFKCSASEQALTEISARPFRSPCRCGHTSFERRPSSATLGALSKKASFRAVRLQQNMWRSQDQATSTTIASIGMAEIYARKSRSPLLQITIFRVNLKS